jgi:hypothetical protein
VLKKVEGTAITQFETLGPSVRGFASNARASRYLLLLVNGLAKPSSKTSRTLSARNATIRGPLSQAEKVRMQYRLLTSEGSWRIELSKFMRFQGGVG